MAERNSLDPVIHQPVRTQLFAYLVSRESVTFTYLKKTLNLSDGNLTAHMKKIIDAGYVEMKKEFVNNKPRTTYTLTGKGRKNFEIYLKRLKKIMEMKSIRDSS